MRCLRPMSHLRLYRAALSRVKVAFATAYVAAATNRITNVASSDSGDDILTSSLLLVSSVAN